MLERDDGADTSELLSRISRISDEVRKMVADFIRAQKPETSSKILSSYMSSDSKRNKAIIFGFDHEVKKDDKKGREKTRYSILSNLEITTSVEFEPDKDKVEK